MTGFNSGARLLQATARHCAGARDLKEGYALEGRLMVSVVMIQAIISAQSTCLELVTIVQRFSVTAGSYL